MAAEEVSIAVGRNGQGHGIILSMGFSVTLGACWATQDVDVSRGGSGGPPHRQAGLVRDQHWIADIDRGYSRLGMEGLLVDCDTYEAGGFFGGELLWLLGGLSCLGFITGDLCVDCKWLRRIFSSLWSLLRSVRSDVGGHMLSS